MQPVQPQSQIIRPPNRSGAALTILVVGIVLSAVAAMFAFREYEANEARKFSEATNEVRDSLETRARAFENMLLQMAGLYALNPKITAEEFHDYAGYAGLPRNDRGVYTFGVFKRLPGKSADDYRMVIDVHEVNPEVPYRTATPGTDISNDPVRMDVIRLAAAEAEPRLSGLITGLSNITGRGYMLVAPAYRNGKIPETADARDKNFVGIAYLRFSEGGIFEIFQSKAPQRTSIDMEVYVGKLKGQTFAKERIAFDRLSDASYTGLRKSDFEIVVGGKPFTVRMFALSGIEGGFGALFAVLILTIGTALSFIGFQTVQRKEVRDQLVLRSERQMKLVTDSLPAMIGYVDTSLSFTLGNRAFAEFFQIKKSEILGKSLADVLGEKNYSTARDSVAKALSGEVINDDWTLERPTGSKHQFQVSLLPDVNASGSVKGIVLMWNDITDRQKSEERSKFLGEFSTVLAASLDPQETAQKIVDLLTPSLAEWSTIDLVRPDGDLAHIAASSANVMSTRSYETKLAKLAARTGAVQSEKDFSNPKEAVVAIPLRSADGILGALTLGSSRPDQNFAKDDIVFAIEIAVRASLAIQNSKLYTDSQELNRAKDNFLAMLSHELRTPMNVILGWLEILTTEEVDKETYDQALDTLNRNARVQIQLINELLDVSRIINGKLTVHPKFCDIGEIAEGSLASVKPAAQAKQITCSLTTRGDLETFADPERMQQILWNLLSNALKFTPAGGEISVEVIGTAHDLTLSVQDSGTGIEKAFLPYVFDRFRQEESTFAKQAGGLGLGLSIVRYLVEAHGGSIGVHSDGKGLGTRFTFVLPRSGLAQT